MERRRRGDYHPYEVCIAPAADASGSGGGNSVSTDTQKPNGPRRKRLEIHLKEGLALYMLLRIGSRLRARAKQNVDNNFKSWKGSAKNRKLNIVVQLIIEELLKHDMVLMLANETKAEANIEHIGTKIYWQTRYRG